MEPTTVVYDHDLRHTQPLRYSSVVSGMVKKQNMKQQPIGVQGGMGSRGIRFTAILRVDQIAARPRLKLIQDLGDNAIQTESV